MKLKMIIALKNYLKEIEYFGKAKYNQQNYLIID